MFNLSEVPTLLAQFGGTGRQPSHVRLYVEVIAACAIAALTAYTVYSRPRFSLRTLLIATTVIAVGLGLIMWLR